MLYTPFYIWIRSSELTRRCNKHAVHVPIADAEEKCEMTQIWNRWFYHGSPIPSLYTGSLHPERRNLPKFCGSQRLNFTTGTLANTLVDSILDVAFPHKHTGHGNLIPEIIEGSRTVGRSLNNTPTSRSEIFVLPLAHGNPTSRLFTWRRCKVFPGERSALITFAICLNKRKSCHGIDCEAVAFHFVC